MRSVKERITANRRRRILSAGGLIAAAILVIGIDYFAYPYGAPVAGQAQNTGENGLWLRYTWYFGRHTDADTDRLAQQLAARQIRYAYFHVRGIQRDGTLKYRFPKEASRLTALMHRAQPSVRAIAWIYAGNKQGIGEVDLGRPDVRRAMVNEAKWLVNTCGFDGVQWDYEICPDGDPNFLSLLQETKATLPPGKILSVAAALWLPRTFDRFGWSSEYYRRIASSCDQITVMAYDSAIYLPRSYVWLVREQVIQSTQAVAAGNPRCRVIIGVPTYAVGGLSHHAHAENITMALRGVREGLSDPRSNKSVFAGVAPFADYTTQPDEWRAYEELWLGTKGR